MLKTNRQKVIFFLRKAFPGQFSVESYFSRLVKDLGHLAVSTHTVESRVHSKGLFNRIKILWQAFSLQRNPGNLLHIAGDVTFAGITAKQPFTMTVLDLEFIRRAHGWRRKLLLWLWIEWPCRRAAKISVISHDTKRSLIEFCPSIDPNKIIPIPVSVSDAFEPINRDFPDGCVNILQVGTKPNKNVPRLIQALNGLNCSLTIIGERTPEIDTTLSEFPITCSFLRDLSQREIVSAYQTCDLVSFVSLEEGFGMPIVEAQRMGRPVVTSNCSAMPETAGNGALLVDPYDVADIRRGIITIMQDGEFRRELIKCGFVNAQRFQRSSIARRFQEMFESVESAP